MIRRPPRSTLFPSRRSSDLSDQSIGAALAEAMAHRGFWLLSASFFVCGFQTIFVMTHLPAYLVDRGLSPAEGMGALATIGLFNIAGSYFAGTLDRKSTRLNSSHLVISYAVFCLKKKTKTVGVE